VKHIRNKLTYSNVMVTVLAVLVIGGGTAYAASEMLPKNTVGSKQIKKEAVTPQAQQSLESRAHGSQGPKGGTGPQGLKGDRGERGEIGPAGPLVETLPSGKTERGQYSFAGQSGTGYSPVNSVSFPFPLKSAPSGHLIAISGARPHMPRNRERPGGRSGESLRLRNPSRRWQRTFAKCIWRRRGRALRDHHLCPLPDTTNWEIEGTWAVTAP